MPHYAPPNDIRIDKEGVWYFKGAEMTRKDIVQLFYQHLSRDESGRYMIIMPEDQCYLDVDDVPFVIACVDRIMSANGDAESYQLRLNDDTLETLDPQTLRIGSGNVLYCSVKGGQFEARFSRAGYYQMADFIEYDYKEDTYFITQRDSRFELAM